MNKTIDFAQTKDFLQPPFPLLPSDYNMEDRWNGYVFLSEEHLISSESIPKDLDKSEVRFNIPFDINRAGPSSIDYRSELSEVRDQGKNGSCLPIAVTTIMEYQKKKAGLTHSLSPEFIYALRTTFQGMMLNDTFRITGQYGVCYEDTLPYRTSRGKRAIITSKMYEEASHFKTDGYIQYNPRNSDAITILNNLLLSGPVLANFLAYNISESPWRKREKDGVLGFHVVVIVGYHNKSDILQYIVRNSWGKDWADSGYTYLPANELALFHDIYVIKDSPSTTLPSPSLFYPQTKKGCCMII